MVRELQYPSTRHQSIWLMSRAPVVQELSTADTLVLFDGLDPGDTMSTAAAPTRVALTATSDGSYLVVHSGEGRHVPPRPAVRFPCCAVLT